MKYVGVTALALVMALGAAGAGAQTRPDFSGTWVLVPEQSRTGGAGNTSAEELTATQNAKTLTVVLAKTPSGVLPGTYVYNLDGSESRNANPGARGGPTELVSRATWEGSSLVISTNFTLPGTTTTLVSRQVLALGAGGTLNVETTTSGMAGVPPVTSRVVYRKR